MKVKVIKNHISNYPNSIDFIAREQVEIGNIDPKNSNWVKVRTENGNEGWTPINMLDISENQKTAITNSIYTAKELNVFANDILTLIKEIHGWAWCKNKTGEFGWVPTENIKNL